MTRQIAMLVLIAVAAGCLHAPPSSPVVVLGSAESRGPCIERVLRRVRSAGLVEHTADRISGFVRVPLERGWLVQVQCSEDSAAATVEIGGWPYPAPLRNRTRRAFDSFASLLEGF